MAAEVLIGMIDNGILLEYLDIRLHDGFTSYKYKELIFKAKEALNLWEVKLEKESNPADSKYKYLIKKAREALHIWDIKLIIEGKKIKNEGLNKEEAIFYLDVKNERQLRYQIEKHGIDLMKKRNNEEIFPLAELDKIRDITPSNTKNP
jgi:hypothetical protein